MYVQRAHELRESGAKISGAPASVGLSNRDVHDSSEDRQRADVFKNFGDRRGSFGWGEKKEPCFAFAKGSCDRDNCRFSHDPADRIDDRLSAGGRGNCEPPEIQRKRQRVGAHGATVDIAAAEEEAARQADEDLEFANPLMRGPTVVKRAKSTIAAETKVEVNIVEPKTDCWTSKKLRVRVIDEAGKFKKHHLKKGVICHVDPSQCCVDIKLDSEDTKVLLRAVPQDLLETVVSKSCKKVEIVRGPQQSMLGELVSRDPRRNLAIVRLGRGNDVHDVELLLDD